MTKKEDDEVAFIDEALELERQLRSKTVEYNAMMARVHQQECMIAALCQELFCVGYASAPDRGHEHAAVDIRGGARGAKVMEQHQSPQHQRGTPEEALTVDRPHRRALVLCQALQDHTKRYAAYQQYVQRHTRSLEAAVDKVTLQWAEVRTAKESNTPAGGLA